MQGSQVFSVQPDGTFRKRMPKPSGTQGAERSHAPGPGRAAARATIYQNGQASTVLQLPRVRPQHQAVSVPDLQKVRRPGPLFQRVQESTEDEHDDEFGVDRTPLLQHRLRTRINVRVRRAAEGAAATAASHDSAAATTAADIEAT